MKLSLRRLGNERRPEPVDMTDVYSIEIESFGVNVRISEGIPGRRKVLSISVNPGDAVMLDVIDIAAHDHQVRLVVGSKEQP